MYESMRVCVWPMHNCQNKGAALPDLVTFTRVKGAWPDFKLSHSVIALGILFDKTPFHG